MRIVIDTNIWISAVATDGIIRKMLNNVCGNKDIVIVLSTSILEEIQATLNNNNRNRKKKKKRRCFTDEHSRRFREILNKATYEIVEIKNEIDINAYIRDENDVHIIETAIIGKADILISGDKDFEDVNLPQFKIMKPSEFNYKTKPLQF